MKPNFEFEGSIVKTLLANPTQYLRSIAHVLSWAGNKVTKHSADLRTTSLNANVPFSMITDCEMSNDYSPIQEGQLKQSESSTGSSTRGIISQIRLRR